MYYVEAFHIWKRFAQIAILTTLPIFWQFTLICLTDLINTWKIGRKIFEDPFYDKKV